MCAEAYNPDDDEDNDARPRVVHPKTDVQRRRLQDACKDILLFKTLEQVQQHKGRMKKDGKNWLSFWFRLNLNMNFRFYTHTYTHRHTTSSLCSEVCVACSVIKDDFISAAKIILKPLFSILSMLFDCRQVKMKHTVIHATPESYSKAICELWTVALKAAFLSSKLSTHQPQFASIVIICFLRPQQENCILKAAVGHTGSSEYLLVTTDRYVNCYF